MGFLGPSISAGWFNINVHATTPFKLFSRTNTGMANRQLQQFTRAASKLVRTEAIDNLLNEIGETAVQDFMHRSGGIQDDKLGIRSGLLAHAVKRESFPEHIQEVNANATGSFGSGKIGVEPSSRLPYPAVHEYGAEIEANKGYMAFRSLRDGKSKLRFAKKVNIPARPYLRPARDKVMKEDSEEKISEEVRKVAMRNSFLSYYG